MKTRLKEFTVENFASLKNVTLRVPSLAMLIGPNGGGKTNILRAMECTWLLEKNIWDFRDYNRNNERSFHFRGEGGSNPRFFGQGQIKFSVTFEADFGDSVGEACVSIGSGPEMWGGSEVPTPLYRVEFSLDEALFVENLRCYAGETEVFEQEKVIIASAMPRVDYYDFQYPHLAGASKIDDACFLRSDGKGLGLVLGKMRDEYPDSFEKIQDKLRQFFPSIKRITLDSWSYQVGVEEYGFPGRVCGGSVPGGILSVLSILVALWRPNEASGGRVICLEDPFRGIHPKLIGKLHDELVGFTEEPHFGQIVFSNSVEGVLDLYQENLEDVFFVRKNHKAEWVLDLKAGTPKYDNSAEGKEVYTVCSSLESEKPLLEHSPGLTLGDLWFSGLLEWE